MEVPQAHAYLFSVDGLLRCCTLHYQSTDASFGPSIVLEPFLRFNFVCYMWCTFLFMTWKVVNRKCYMWNLPYLCFVRENLECWLHSLYGFFFVISSLFLRN